jgi:amidohydrolase
MKRIGAAGLAAALCLGAAGPALAAAPGLAAEIDARAKAGEQRLIAWRRDIHEHPELGNRETRTSALVADHLRRLGMEVRTGIAGTGVVGVLKGGRPGPVVALRADMDALPVKEATGLPFASTAVGNYRGVDGPVMHACGHDAHVAILMSAAEVLAGMKDRLPGTVVFVFQPAEETPADFTPDGSRFWGARQMVAEGALDNPKVEAIFGLHVIAGIPSGTLEWRPGPTMAGADLVQIQVRGRGTHGARPWGGVDPIVLSAQVLMGIQTISSRQVDVSKEPSIISFGQIHGGTRENIIPDTVDMEGSIRSYDRPMQLDIHSRIRRTSELIAQSGGGSAKVNIVELFHATVNDAGLTARMTPTLQRVMGPGKWRGDADKRTGSEDFSFYQEKAPGLFVHLGVTPPEKMKDFASNHSPEFFVDEAALIQGVRIMANLAADYLAGPAG